VTQSDSPTTATQKAGPEARLNRFSGEFVAREEEALFDTQRLADTIRQTKALLLASALMSLLLYVDDRRLFSAADLSPMLALPAAIAGVSLLFFVALRFCKTPGRLGLLMTAWMLFNALAAAVLVSVHDNVALFLVILLPVAYYLFVPASFAQTVFGGVAASALMLFGYHYHGQSAHGTGLMLAVAMLNGAAILATSRSNRLRRLQWLAGRARDEIMRELAASQEMLRTMFAASPVPMVVTAGTGGPVLHINDSAVALIGAPREEIDAGTMTRFYADAVDQQRLKEMLDRDGMVDDFELAVKRADGTPRVVLLKAATVDMPGGRVNIVGIIDISDRKEAELSLARLASTDPLTELPNRLSFLASAHAEMKRATRSQRPLSLLMIDLDHFKGINDTFGHRVGDEVLRAFAMLCRQRLREHDVAGRLGGEEFGVLLPNADLNAALRIAEQLCDAVANLRMEGAPGLSISASIGIAAVRPDEDSLDPALVRADTALYAAKAAGRSCVRVNSMITPRRAS